MGQNCNPPSVGSTSPSTAWVKEWNALSKHAAGVEGGGVADSHQLEPGSEPVPGELLLPAAAPVLCSGCIQAEERQPKAFQLQFLIYGNVRRSGGINEFLAA